MKKHGPPTDWDFLLAQDPLLEDFAPKPPESTRRRPSPYLLGFLGILCVAFAATKISAYSASLPVGRTISGSVTFRDKPVVFGAVVIIDSDGLPKSGSIQPDGSFIIEQVISSSPKIAVSSPPPPGANSGGPQKGGRDATDPDKSPSKITPYPPEIIKKWFPLPNEYGEHHRSGINSEIQNDVLTIALK